MAIEIKESDVIKGNSFEWGTTDGITLTRGFIVTGIEGNPDAKQFLAATAPGMPNHGDEHDAVRGSFVQSKSVTIIGSGQAEVLVTYAPFKGGESNPDDGEQAYRTKRYSGSVQTVETNQSLSLLGGGEEGKKELITVEYEWPEGKSPGPKTIDVQVGRVRKEDAFLTMEISTIETQDPFDKILQYQGTMNSLTWSKGRPRQWFLRQIDSSTTDDGETFKMTYRFQFKQDLWDVDVAYIDPRTGRPPPDIDAAGNDDTGQVDQSLSLRAFRIYREEDFSKLNIGG